MSSRNFFSGVFLAFFNFFSRQSMLHLFSALQLTCFLLSQIQCNPIDDSIQNFIQLTEEQSSISSVILPIKWDSSEWTTFIPLRHTISSRRYIYSNLFIYCTSFGILLSLISSQQMHQKDSFIGINTSHLIPLHSLFLSSQY